ncbi:hypothetical protein AHIS2_p065 [Acaryochloris phage A-HIS2]|nr:hypothetical protein AHIS2_p065 [Acaryochloris phage A-HIS2]
MIITQQETKLNDLELRLQWHSQNAELSVNYKKRELVEFCKYYHVKGFKTSLRKPELQELIVSHSEKCISALRYEIKRITKKVRKVTKFSDMLLTGERYVKPVYGF